MCFQVSKYLYSHPLTNKYAGPKLQRLPRVSIMNRRHPSHSQPLATYLTGLTLIILLCALVSGGALRASHTVTVNPQFTVELQHLVAVSHIEKIRVEKPDADSDRDPENDRHSPVWLIDGTDTLTRQLTSADGAPGIGLHVGVPSSHSFFRPPLRAPPLS